MEYELTSESIKSLFPMGKESMQMVIDGDMIVPDIKPDMDYIADCRVKAVITDENIFEGRISFKGRLETQIIYCSEEGGGKIYALKGLIPFEDFINADGISVGDYAVLTPVAEHVEHKMINSRKASVKCILSVKADIWNMHEEYAAAECKAEGALCRKNKEISVKKTVGTVDNTFKIADELHIPSSKGAVEDIVYMNECLTGVEMKAADGGVRVSGRIKIEMVYIADEGGTPESVSFELPLDGFADCPQAETGDFVWGRAYIKNCTTDIFTDNDGFDRGMMADIEIAVKAEVLREKKINVLEDAYSDKKCVETEYEDFSYPIYVGSNKNRTALKETLKSDEGEILKFINAYGMISYWDVQAQQSMATVNGIAEISALCLSKSDERPLITLSASVPFSQEVEISGAEENDFLCACVNADDIQINVLNGQEAEASVYLNIDVCAQRKAGGRCVKKIEECENAPDTPSAAIYVVQPGDSLWEIAKKYRTSTDNIVRLNGIENPDLIYPGQKILILKKINL